MFVKLTLERKNLVIMGKISNTWDRNRLHTNRSIPRACPSSSNLGALTTELNEQTANRIGFGSNSHQAFHLDDAERRRRLLGDLRHGLQERPRSSRRRCCRPASQTPGLEREMGCEPDETMRAGQRIGFGSLLRFAMAAG